MKKKRIDYFRILALFIVLLGIIYFYLNFFFPRFIPPPFRLGVLRRPVNYLLVGTDVTFDLATGKPLWEGGGRADTIMILHLNPGQQKLNLLSIPRDTYTSIPNYGKQKINSAQVYGGVSLTKQTIVDLAGLEIQGYFEMHPQAIPNLVDLLGGIYLEVEKDMYYVDRAQNLYINLKKGGQKLSGKEAQGYIRYRYDAEGDIARIARQQKFLRTLFKTMGKPLNLLKTPYIFSLTLKNIKTDLNPKEIIRFLNSLRMMSWQNIHPFTLSGEAVNLEGVGSVWLPNEQELKRIIKEYF